MALRRNAPDKVKLKLKGDGRPLGDLGQDLVQPKKQEQSGIAEIHDREGRAMLDWSGGNGAAAFGHTDPAVAEKIVTAGLDALGEADPDARSRLVELTDRLAGGLGEIEAAPPAGITIMVRSQPGLAWLTFPADPEGTLHARFRRGMQERGIWLPAGPDAPWLISLGHDQAAVDRTLMAVADALGDLS